MLVSSQLENQMAYNHCRHYPKVQLQKLRFQIRDLGRMSLRGDFPHLATNTYNFQLREESPELRYIGLYVTIAFLFFY